MPLFLIHCTENPEAKDAERFFRALERLGKTAQPALYPGEGHGLGIWSLHHAVDACRRMIAFCDEYTRPDP